MLKLLKEVVTGRWYESWILFGIVKFQTLQVRNYCNYFIKMTHFSATMSYSNTLLREMMMCSTLCCINMF